MRSQFPALSRANAEGIVPAYFDGPGGTQVPQRVLDAIRDYLVGSNSNIEGEYEASIRTDELIAQARVARRRVRARRPRRCRVRPERHHAQLPADPGRRPAAGTGR